MNWVDCTLTGLPVVGQHVAVGAGTECSAQGIETGVRAAEIVAQLEAFIEILARMAVTGQLGAGPLLAAAFVRAVRVATTALTRTVSIPQKTFVVICRCIWGVKLLRLINVPRGLTRDKGSLGSSYRYISCRWKRAGTPRSKNTDTNPGGWRKVPHSRRYRHCTRPRLK